MNKIKQTEKVLAWLKVYGELTTIQAVTELGILSLPRRIMELRQAGFKIDREYRRSKNGSRYGVYKLAEGGATV